MRHGRTGNIVAVRCGARAVSGGSASPAPGLRTAPEAGVCSEFLYYVEMIDDPPGALDGDGADDAPAMRAHLIVAGPPTPIA